MVVLALDDETMVIEDNCGYIQLEVKKQVPTAKKDVIHYDRIEKIRKELHEDAKLEVGMPSEEEISKFLLNDIPLPSKSKVETLKDAQIESMVPSTDQILEQMLKGKTTSEQKKPNLDADGLPTIEQIRAELGIKEVV